MFLSTLSSTYYVVYGCLMIGLLLSSLLSPMVSFSVAGIDSFVGATVDLSMFELRVFGVLIMYDQPPRGGYVPPVSLFSESSDNGSNESDSSIADDDSHGNRKANTTQHSSDEKQVVHNGSASLDTDSPRDGSRMPVVLSPSNEESATQLPSPSNGVAVHRNMSSAEILRALRKAAPTTANSATPMTYYRLIRLDYGHNIHETVRVQYERRTHQRSGEKFLGILSTPPLDAPSAADPLLQRGREVFVKQLVRAARMRMDAAEGEGGSSDDGSSDTRSGVLSTSSYSGIGSGSSDDSEDPFRIEVVPPGARVVHYLSTMPYGPLRSCCIAYFVLSCFSLAASVALVIAALSHGLPFVAEWYYTTLTYRVLFLFIVVTNVAVMAMASVFVAQQSVYVGIYNGFFVDSTPLSPSNRLIRSGFASAVAAGCLSILAMIGFGFITAG